MHDGLSAFFLICFLVGAVFTFVTLLTGVAHLPLPGGHVVHLGHAGTAAHGASAAHAVTAGHAGQVAHGGHGAGHAAERSAASAFNAGSVLAFLACFGGVGYILHSVGGLGLLLVLGLAVLAGIGGAALIAAFLLLVLIPAQTSIDPEQYRLDGTTARVTVGIPRGGTGEIIYTKAGTRRGEAARSIDDEPIPRDEEVVILSYQRGVAYVQPLQRYLHSSAAVLAERLAALDQQNPALAPPPEPGAPSTATPPETRA